MGKLLTNSMECERLHVRDATLSLTELLIDYPRSENRSYRTKPKKTRKRIKSINKLHISKINGLINLIVEFVTKLLLNNNNV